MLNDISKKFKPVHPGITAENLLDFCDDTLICFWFLFRQKCDRLSNLNSDIVNVNH